MHYAIALVVFTTLLAGCGGKKSEQGKAGEDALAGPTVAPIATPPIGIDAIKRMNFVYGDGRKDYDRVLAAYRAKPRDWAAVRTHAEAALAKDPFHLDAHRVLASALAHAGEHAAAVDHLVAALAGDYFKYGPSLATDDDLAEFLATPHGTAVTEVAAKIRAEYLRRLPAALLVVAQRSPFRWPGKDGVQQATSRGELYAFDRETRRYFRLTHTEHQVVAFVRAPSGGEVAVLGFDKVERSKTDDAPPLVARAWVQVIDTKEWTPGARVTLPAAREIALGYAGDTLVVGTAAAAGRWGVAAPVVQAFAKETAKDGKPRGKLTQTDAALPTPRVVFSLEEGRLVRTPDGVDATWAGDPPTTPTLAVAGGGAKLTVPESGAAAQAAIALAPDKARIAFATAVDPCAQDTAPSLYVADAKTGALDHVITARSRFASRWLDATTLAYEDGEGAIRFYDATTGREALRLDNKPGIALDVLSLAGGPVCKGTPPTTDPAHAGSAADDEPPLPPEEPAGPVTSP